MLTAEESPSEFKPTRRTRREHIQPGRLCANRTVGDERDTLSTRLQNCSSSGAGAPAGSPERSQGGKLTEVGCERRGLPWRFGLLSTSGAAVLYPPERLVSSGAVPEFRLQLSIHADELVEFDIAGRPAGVDRYSVVLRHLGPEGQATAVRVYDNSHDRHEHHMHRCDQEGRREQPPEIFHHGEPYEALKEARNLVENGFEEMISAWRR
jgi:hypothetical protein